MSLLKSVSTEIKGNKVQVNFPEKKTIVLRGQNALHILYTVESLLAQDFTEYYSELDKQYGYYYGNLEGTSILVFNDSAIFGRDKQVKVQGLVPNVHVIRYLDANFRSFYLSSNLTNFSPVYTDMRHYSHIIQDAQWVRLVSVVNNVLGFELVEFKNNDLFFKFQSNNEISIQGQQIVYLLMAECFLTPPNYHRVLLIPEIEYLPKEVYIRFLEALDNIKGHTLTLSVSDIQPMDLKASSVISFLNV